MKNKSVVYLLSGQAHAPYLVASAYTLRKHWKGSISIFSWSESYEIAKQIAEDSNIGACVYEREPKLRRKDGVRGNAQFLDKIDLMSSLNDDPVLYLDADTTNSFPPFMDKFSLPSQSSQRRPFLLFTPAYEA